MAYIGHASLNETISEKLGELFVKDPRDGSCYAWHNEWPSSPCYVATLRVDRDMSFEAPAIKEFLYKYLGPFPLLEIKRLYEPPFNKKKSTMFKNKNFTTVRVRKKPSDYPLWQYLLAIVLAPFFIALIIFIMILLNGKFS